jgi:hypothetical protein
MITKALGIIAALALVSSLILGKLWLGARGDGIALEIANKAVISQLEVANKQYMELINRESISEDVEVEKEQKLVVIEQKKDKTIEAIDKLPHKCIEDKNEKDNVAGVDDYLPPELDSLLSEVHL